MVAFMENKKPSNSQLDKFSGSVDLNRATAAAVPSPDEEEDPII
jgi:hypothetical protein